MKVSEIPAKWQSLNNLLYHYTESDKQIAAIFKAPADDFIASEVHRFAKDGYGFPLFPHERNNPYMWVAFRDNSVELLSEVLRDEKLVKVLDEQGVQPVNLTVKEDWSVYVQWPRGFDIWLSYSSQPLQYEVRDEATGEAIGQTIPENWRNTIRLNCRNGHRRVEKMKKPCIRFKAAPFKTTEITVSFQARVI